MNYQCDDNAKLAPVLDQGSVRSEIEALVGAIGQESDLKSPPNNQKLMYQQLDDRDIVEKQRIKRWRDKKMAENPSFSYKQRIADKQDCNIYVEADYKNGLTQLQKAELQHATMHAATGSAGDNYGQMLLNQTLNGLFLNKLDPSFIANAGHEALLALAPQDAIEGMLCSRLVVLHNQYMEFLGRSAHAEKTSTSTDMTINWATKLIRLYNETLDALSKYRRKGEQKVVVQHVNVGNGGQAVVSGEFTQGGGVHDKK